MVRRSRARQAHVFRIARALYTGAMTTTSFRRILWTPLTVALLVGTVAWSWPTQPDEPSNDRDDVRLPSDPISRLIDDIAAGEITLAYDSAQGYLSALLEVLDIPISTQGLVFSRTSLQTDRVAPWAPRALYYNDDVYVGWVLDSPIIEIASIDPLEGSVFYTLAQRPEGPPRFEREGTTCLMCHESGITEGVPGLIMRSVLADRLGYPVTDVHEGQTTDRTPLHRRWGGWYVTGTHGDPGHAGNRRAEELDAEISSRAEYLRGFDMNSGGNALRVGEHFDTTAYLSPHSDLISLMVLTHQVRVHNLMSLVHQQGTRALGGVAAQKGGPAAGGNRSVAAVDRLVRAMLFVDEAELTGPIRGTSTFAEDFPLLGPFDQQGRSLRDFDLEYRLFRYPLSFLIYTDAFDAMPEFARNHVYDRLDDILTSEPAPGDFEHLSTDVRVAIHEILMDTKPDFASRIATR